MASICRAFVTRSAAARWASGTIAMSCATSAFGCTKTVIAADPASGARSQALRYPSVAASDWLPESALWESAIWAVASSSSAELATIIRSPRIPPWESAAVLFARNSCAFIRIGSSHCERSATHTNCGFGPSSVTPIATPPRSSSMTSSIATPCCPR